MKITVDNDICGLHGQCVFSAPEIFGFDESGELEYVEEISDELAAKARTAAAVCPTGAIELTE